VANFYNHGVALAILVRSPMSSTDDDGWLVFNGTFSTKRLYYRAIAE